MFLGWKSVAWMHPSSLYKEIHVRHILFIFFVLSTVFSGVKAAVFSGEKKSKSRGAAYTQQQQNSAVKTSRPFARMGL